LELFEGVFVFEVLIFSVEVLVVFVFFILVFFVLVLLIDIFVYSPGLSAAGWPPGMVRRDPSSL